MPAEPKCNCGSGELLRQGESARHASWCSVYEAHRPSNLVAELRGWAKYFDSRAGPMISRTQMGETCDSAANEIERLQLAVTAAHAERTRELGQMRQDFAGVAEENERLRKALVQYGAHTYRCHVQDGMGACDCGWRQIDEKLSGTAGEYPHCPTCGQLYTGRGGQLGLPVMLNCPNGHSWPDPRGGVNK